MAPESSLHQKTEVDLEELDAGSMDEDAIILQKLGVRQETKRRFGFWTVLGLVTSLMCSWESAVAFFVTAFVNGGGVSMMYGYIFAFFGTLATGASLAEMASAYPISGGQYHWTALLAPERSRKFLSWLTGWLSALGWQAACATGTYLGGTIIQALVHLNNPSYMPERWQATLILYAVLLLTLLVNTVLVRLLPGIEATVLVIHCVGWLLILVPLVVLAPKSSNAFVWTEFTNLSGYNNGGLSWLIGQSASAILFIGYDGACHLAEEVEDAANNVPRAMVYTICINGALGFAMYLVILYCFGQVMPALDTPSHWPFLEIFLHATGSKAGTIAMASLLVAMYIFATFGFVASASRQAWAFSRDNGLPFSSIFRRIDNRLAIPLWTLALTGVINALLGLINIGSSVAFGAVVSLVVSSYLSSYLIPLVLIVNKRLRREKIDFGPWTLGRWGLPINIIAAAYTLLTVVFAFFPPLVPVNAVSMNWSCAVYGGVIILGIFYYIVSGRKHYNPPSVRPGGNRLAL